MNPVIEEYVGDKKIGKEKFSTRWWNFSKEDIYKHIFGTVEMLENRQTYRSLANIKHSRLYSNLEILGVYAGIYTAPVNDHILPNRISLNVVKSCVDTVTSKIAKAKPRPVFLTDRGDWALQEKAKSLTQFLDGAFDSMGLYSEKPKSFRDSGVLGTGAVKFYTDETKMEVCCERTIIEELLVDDADGIYGKPQVLFQRRLVNKSVLKDMFPKIPDHIIEEATNGIPNNLNSDMVKDLVKVIEAWHLPSGPNSDDGLHVMCIDNHTLFVEKWDKCYFPFVFDRWTERLLGFWGMGLAEELLGIQLEINKILKNIQLSMHLFAVPRVYLDNASQINMNGINNDIASFVKYTGKQPIFHTPQAMAPDVYNHLWNLVQKAYEITGISQLSAQSQKPAGLNSGAAIREYQDVESDRFQIVGQRYETTFLDAARIVIDMTKDLAKKGKVIVKVESDSGMKTINFKDVNLDETKYLMRMFPTSILPTQPAGKLQKVTELVQAGFVDKETALDLLDFPDIKAATDKALAPRRVIIKMLDKIINEGVYESPEPFMNLALAERIALDTYLYARSKNVDEERLELVRRFIDDVQSLKQLAVQGQQQMMAEAAPAGIATPPPAPVSDILPIGGE